MFGYTVPIEGLLSANEAKVYRNYYCETCHQLRENYGYISTMSVNYEMTFANMFFSSILDEGILIEEQPKGKICIIKHSASNAEFMKKLAAYTILVANNSLVDDKEDDVSSLKANLGLLGLNRAITKAKEDYPEYDEVIMKGYRKLVEIEKSGEKDAIVVGRYSAQSMIDVLDLMFGDDMDVNVRELFRNLGIWVYVMDAVEDLDDDMLEGAFNPFLVNKPAFKNKKAFINDNIFLIGEMMGSIITNIQQYYTAVRPELRFNQNILDNIIFQGIPQSAHRIMRGDNSMSLSLKNMFTGRMNRGAPPSTI